MEEKKGFAAEFKEFIMRGNVMDMAVGIIIGGAFTAIVTSLVNDILMPVIGAIIGGVDFSKLCIEVGKAQIMYGNFIMAIINFVLIALVIFLLIKTMNKLRRPAEEPAEDAAPEEPAADIVLLGEIRDLLKNK